VAATTGIGAPVRRKEDQRFITGKGQYTDDINRPGQAYAVFVRSPHAHANIKSIDTSGAKTCSGFVAVFTGADLAKDKVGNLICGWMIHSKDGSPMKAGAHPALAQGKVRYVGDHVAVVIADTLAEARDAAEKVEVAYEPLPAVVDVATAQSPGQAQVHAEAPNNTVYQWHLGDKAAVDAAFADAKHKTRIELVNNRLIPNAIEPRAAIGEYDSGNESLTLYTTSQNPHVTRLVLAAFIGLAPEHKLRVIAPDVGGGFGSKIFIYAEETVCLWASRKVGRPVKWTADRSESFLADAHGRDHVTTAEMAVDGEGKILALRASTKANLGGYLSTFASSVPTYLYAPLLSGQYDIPAIYCEVDGVYTTTAPVDAYRGAGRPEATFVVERLVEVTARQIGQNPAEFRRKNFIRSFPHTTPVIMTYDAGDYEACLNKALELADHKSVTARKAESAKRGMKRGVGFSAYIEACGIAPSAAVGSLGAGVGLWESAEVRVNPTGSVEVLTGSHSHGQGHETTFAQLVSHRLGIPIEQITVVHGDTDKVQFGMGTYGSRSGAVGMTAVQMAVDKVIVKAKKVAGFVLEVAADTVDFKEGIFSSSATNKTLTFPEVALQAYIAHKFTGAQLEPGLKEGAFFDPTNFTFPAGVHICEVEIDPETGATRIDRWTAVDDFGTLVNPMIVEGQVHGGVAQGVGQALLEGAVYSKEGQLVTASYMDYCMPRAGDLPHLQVAMTSTPCPSNPLGIKGCGEAGAIAAPAAVINAITDALGHEAIAMPATPQAVWRAAQASPTKMAAE
jgi:aerobic carbon-monoxide dehydrogenase large subunit